MLVLVESTFPEHLRKLVMFVFFFQAEDGIRDLTVTGVQTCALPISAELVRLKVDIMFAVGNQAIQTAKQATRTIPIVMIGSDAVAPGTAVRLDESSGNVTGVTYSSAELARSWVKLLKELRPTLSRVAVLYNADPTSQVELTSLQRAAAAAGMKIQAYAIQEGEAIGNAFAGTPPERAEAVIVPGGPLAILHPRRS